MNGGIWTRSGLVTNFLQGDGVLLMRLQPRALSLRRNFAWSFVGNSVYNLTQWLLLVFLARLGNAELVGQFALSLAISAPVFLCIGLNLRVVRATDVARAWRQVDYLRLRSLLNILAAIVSMAVGLVLGLRGEELLVLAAIAAAKSVEATSHTYYGLFQLRERLDLVARSLLLRAAMGAVLFVVGIATTGRLVFACLGLFLGWVLPLLVIDRRMGRQLVATESSEHQPFSNEVDWPAMVALAKKASPLGVDAGLSSLSINVPRYLVEILLGTARLGVFAALAYLAQVISMIAGAMGETVVPRLAVYYAARERRLYLRLLAQLTGFGAAVTVAVMSGALLVGAPFIKVTLGPDYVDLPLLVILMLSAGLTTIQRCLGRGLQAAHQYTAFLIADVVTLASIVLVGPFLVSDLGVVGAAWSLCVGFAVGIVTTLLFLVRVVREFPRDLASADDESEEVL